MLGRLPGRERYSLPGSRRASSLSQPSAGAGSLPSPRFYFGMARSLPGLKAEVGSGDEFDEAALLHPEFGIMSLFYLQVGLRVKPPSLFPPLPYCVSYKD